jgi:hypothetical protein
MRRVVLPDYLPVTGASFAVWADGSSLIRWAGQAAHTVGGMRGAGWTPTALPPPLAFRATDARL